MKESDARMTTNRQANRLIHEKSPYLLQHAYNPVDWFPWCEEAFQKAKSEEKPIFLSIGYSTCHWCHVMERESFEDEEVASLLNENFVSIKVDREERPDVDHVYMTVCQALTGHGGWPLSIFMTPDKKPFFTGTYFPKHDRMSLPGFKTILEKIAAAWKQRKEELLASGEKITNVLTETFPEADRGTDEEVIHRAFEELNYSFDSVYGGFGSAPKFPTPHNIMFLLRYWYFTGSSHALEMAEKTLDSMYRGGIYDHIGFGFSRYSTDRKWLVPHFEKMLYDNALLAMAYLEAFEASGNKKYARIAREIFTYVLRDMTSPEGAFYSAEDADSEGEEGRFYLWTPDEVLEVLGSFDGEKFCRYFDITSRGNFEGRSIPNLIKGDVPEEDMALVQNLREKLFSHREKRVRPFRDDKVLTSWNGLMIAAMARGGRVLQDSSYISAAEKAAGFLLTRLVREDGRLMARYREGEAAYPAYADDYAFLIWGLLELYQATYKTIHLKKALELNDQMVRLFWDRDNGGLFIYGSDSEQLIARPREVYDGATPSANSVAAYNFIRMARLTGRHDLEELAERQFEVFGELVSRAPSAYTFFLTAFMTSRAPFKEVVVVGSSGQAETRDMLEAIRQGFRPFIVSMLCSEEHEGLKDLVPYIANYKPVDGKPTAYVCRNFACKAPITQAEELRQELDQ